MFVYLSKLLPLFLYPLGIAFFLVLLALFLARHVRAQRAVLLAALLLLWASSNRWTSLWLARTLEWRYLPPQEIPTAEVIVVLGGGTESADFPRSGVELNSAGDRVLYAAWLYQQGKAEHLLLSGGSIEWRQDSSTPAEEMAALLQRLGIPREALWLETQSRNTYENALNCRKILEAKGIQRIILVTSALHMPRAVALFEHQGLEVIPAPTDFKVTQENWQALRQASLPVQLLNLLPSADNLSSVTSTLKEYLGILVYSLRGWMTPP
ncbi:MAG: YdcF family protein [Candidatus Methanomethyliaceae archaeon]